jgi:hypothetical protein
MRTTRAFTLGCMALATLCSCRKELTADAIAKSLDAIAQQGPAGTSLMIVRPDGSVSGTLQTPDGKPVTQPVAGQITFATPAGPPTVAPVQYDPKTGVLTAAGPKLDADVTPVSYTLSAGGTPWTGTIDVPKGGTQELADTAKLQGSISANTVGPNGGVIQVVGPDRVELVASKRTGDVRAYVLDAENQPVDPGDRKITLALGGEQPEVVVLAPEPQAHFVVGHLRARVDPPELTVAVNLHGTTHACLSGWSPGTVFVEGPEAPRVHLLAVDAWPGEVVEVHGLHGHHEQVLAGVPGVVVDGPGVVIDAPRVVVGAPGVVVGAPGVIVGGPGVVVGGPGVVVGGPGVVVGGPRVVVGGPGVFVGGGAEVHGGGGIGWGHGHGHGHGHDR